MQRGGTRPQLSAGVAPEVVDAVRVRAAGATSDISYGFVRSWESM